MVDLEFLAGLQYCGCVIDGTLMKIEEAIQHGDCYCCYKKIISTLTITTDASGLFLKC